MNIIDDPKTLAERIANAVCADLNVRSPQRARDLVSIVQWELDGPSEGSDVAWQIEWAPGAPAQITIQFSQPIGWIKMGTDGATKIIEALIEAIANCGGGGAD